MADLFFLSKQQLLDSNGDPVSGAKAFFYEAGTTTPLATYSDESLSTLNANPLVADADGRFGAIFLQAASYKLVVTGADDVTVYSIDNIVPTSGPEDWGAITGADGKEVALRGGTTAQNDAFTGTDRELTVDTERRELRLHDGATQGGRLIPGWVSNPAAFAAEVEAAAADANILTGETNILNYNDPFDRLATELIRLPAGDFTLDVGDLDLAGRRIKISGAGPQHTRIRIPDGSYLFDESANMIGVEFEDVTFYGGKGVLRLADDTQYSRGFYRFERCVFMNYTECALGNLSTDFGRWLIRYCLFWGRGSDSAGLSTIGVALRGIQDNSIIEHNFFHKNKHNLKLGRSAAVFWVRNNSFLIGDDAGTSISDIWLVPDGPVTFGGLQITDNRFGNENLEADHFRILVADEDAGSGADFMSRDSHSTSVSSGRIDGVVVERNYASGTSNRALIYSYTPQLNGWTIDNHLRAMSKGDIEFAPAVAANISWVFNGTNRLGSRYIIDPASRVYPEPSVPSLFTIEDLSGVYGGAASAPQFHPGAGDDIGYKALIGPALGSAYNGAEGSPSINADTDSLGGPEAVLIGFAGDDTSFTYAHRVYWNLASIVSADVGRLHWIEFEIKQASSDSLETIGLSIRSSAPQMVWRRVIELPANWKLVRYPFIPTASGSFTLNVHSVGWESGVKTDCLVGRPRVYRANEPVNHAHLRCPDSVWNGGHLILGAYHLWVDATGDLRIKSSAPTSDTDGAVVGTQT